MISLRHFCPRDAEAVRGALYPDRTADEAAAMIAAWNTCVYQGRYFETFAVLRDDAIVGQVSLSELSRSVVSAGVEITGAQRGKGFASEALSRLLKYASDRKYRLVLDQVRTDNPASIKLHEKLGFESDGYVYRNRRDHAIFLYIKPL